MREKGRRAKTQQIERRRGKAQQDKKKRERTKERDERALHVKLECHNIFK
jgi:hypothetical protein